MIDTSRGGRLVAAIATMLVVGSLMPTPTSAATAFASGLYITGGGGRAFGAYDYADATLDRSGTAHAVGVVAVDYRYSTIQYATHRRGTTGWVRRTAATDLYTGEEGTGATVIVGTSLDGRWVNVIVETCKGISTQRTPVDSLRLPPPELLEGADECWDDLEGPDVQAMTALPRGRVAVLVTNEAGTPHIRIGVPGGAFRSPVEIPDSGRVFPSLLTRDPITGDLVMVGWDSADGVWAWTKRPSASWSAPRLITTSRSLVPTSVTARDGHAFVGLTACRHCYGLPPRGIFLVHRGAGGRWHARQRVPGSTSTDTGVQLVLSRWSGHLHVAFTRQGSAPDQGAGIIHEAFRDGAWSPLRFLTHWRYDNLRRLETPSRNGRVAAVFKRTSAR